MRRNSAFSEEEKAQIPVGICSIPPACGFGCAVVVDEKVPHGVYRMVVQAVFERQFAGGSGTAGVGIMIAPHRLYQPLTSRRNQQPTPAGTAANSPANQLNTL
jgi:hypothetical protein